MCEKEKQILVSIITSIITLSLYSFYVYKQYYLVNPAILEDLSFLGKAFFILIPISIISQIIVHILFAIINKIVTKEDLSSQTDERDKIIELKAVRIAHWVFILGFMLSMAFLAMGMQIWVMLITLISSGFMASILSESAKLFFYRRGV